MSNVTSEQIDVLNPATGEVIGRIPAGGAEEAAAAVSRARAAQSSWERTAAGERSAGLKEGARRLRQHIDELAQLQTAENGKPLGDSRGGVEAGIGAIDQYAELGPLHRGRSLQGGWMATDVMIHCARGVAACMVPWNDPVAIACQMLAANLAVGNTVVLKPSEKTPLATARIVELLNEGLPDGVLVLAEGDGRIGRALVEHPDVDLVLHTGSVRTGREIAELCGRMLKKAVLELGGKDPLIVDAGVDPAWAAEQAAIGAFANAGQICVSVERIYVHEAVAGPFTDELVKRAQRLVVGDGTDPATEMGPLIDAGQRAIVDRHVQAAVAGGARALAGGRPVDGPGFFYEPTVLVDVRDDMTVMTEETFGPVAPVRIVGSFDEALELANGTQYGLAATVLTPSHEHAQQAWRELQAGTVKVNAVFGGAPGGAASPHKASGLGFGYGPELLDEVSQVRVVHMAPDLRTGGR